MPVDTGIHTISAAIQSLDLFYPMEPIKSEHMKKEPGKRKRPFLPKTKTGCLTCKVRKVKCDEEKPACRRCTSTGRKCDGYAPAPTSTNTTPHSRHSSPGRAPQSDLFASDAEKRSFAYFETRACHDLGGSFHRQFWSEEVLQAVTHYTSIRHLVIAIGAAYEGFQNRSLDLQTSDEYNNSMKFSMEQSNQSIQLMGALFNAARAEGQSTETTCNILTASILFAYLACLQGHISQAIEHVHSGLNVLQSFDKARAAKHATSTFPVSISHLRSLLTSLYVQIRGIINDEAQRRWERDPLVSTVEPVISFSGISEAHSYVEGLWCNLLAFLQHTELNPPTTTDDVARFTANHQLLSQAFNSSCAALELMASRHAFEDIGQDEAAITILRLYHTVIAIRLRINPLEPGTRESAFDNLQAELEQMLQYCELLVNSSQSAFTRPSFSSGLGYVAPLHTIAARCRNPRVRRRALQLLLTSGRREGLWDGLLTGKIVTKTIEREERLASSNIIPGDSRVREVKVEFLGERKARLRYVSVADWRARLYGEQHILEW